MTWRLFIGQKLRKKIHPYYLSSKNTTQGGLSIYQPIIKKGGIIEGFFLREIIFAKRKGAASLILSSH